MIDRMVINAHIRDACCVLSMRSPLCPPPARASGTTSSEEWDHLTLAAGNGADHTTPIALAARGSVQSSVNEVAPGALGVVGVARPHRSL